MGEPRGRRKTGEKTVRIGGRVVGWTAAGGVETGYRDSRRGDSDSGGGGLAQGAASRGTGDGWVDQQRQKLLRRAIWPSSAIVIGRQAHRSYGVP